MLCPPQQAQPKWTGRAPAFRSAGRCLVNPLRDSSRVRCEGPALLIFSTADPQIKRRDVPLECGSLPAGRQACSRFLRPDVYCRKKIP
jgi:hypothetical protein